MNIISKFNSTALPNTDVCIIMPAYNSETFIGESIDSILSQTFEDYTLLVIDDGSTDNTWDKLLSIEHSKIYAYRLDKNQGPLKVRNMAFEKITSKYIAFQDSDDISDNNRIETQVDFLTKNPSIMMCGTSVYNLFGSNKKLMSYPQNQNALISNLARGSTKNFCGASVMFRSELLKNIGLYRLLFDKIGSADIDWQIRVLEEFNCANIARPLYYYRQHTNAFSKQNKHILSEHSADIAYFCHILRKSSIQSNEDIVYQFLISKYKEPVSTIADSQLNKIIRVLLYRFLPEYLLSHIVSRNRRHKVMSWLDDYNNWLGKIKISKASENHQMTDEEE